MSEFYNTKMGRTFFEGTMPRIVRSLNTIAEALGPLAQLAEKIYRQEQIVTTLTEDLLIPDSLVKARVYDLPCNYLFEVHLPGVPEKGSIISIPEHNYQIEQINYAGERAAEGKYLARLDLRVKEV